MQFDLDQRTATLSVGDFAAFVVGPHGRGDATGGRWRAQLGTYWHQQLRAQRTADEVGTRFEVPIEGRIFHHGWTISLAGRIDQWLEQNGITVLREIKTVTRPLPADEHELRAEY